MNKADIYTEIYKILSTPNENKTVDIDKILLPLCDYFDSNDLEGFLKHLKEENGING